MNLLKIGISLLAVVMTSACSLQKDPLADQPDYIKNAQPGLQKVEKPLSDQDWVINSDNGASFFAFTEGQQAQATIQAAMLVDGYTWEVYVENQDDFKDATFVQQGKDWVFTWTPPLNIVPSTAPLVLPMRVVIAAKDVNQKTVKTKSKDFPVLVTANRGAPVFVKDENFPTGNVREGESRTFYVYIRDTDSQGTSRMAPQVHFEPAITSSSFGQVDVSAFLTLGSPSQDATDPTLWKYQVIIDLSDKNLTTTTSTGVFRMIAVSRSKLESTPKDYQFTVLTGVSRPVPDFYTGDVVQVQKGTKLSKQINFIDPKGKGSMSAAVETLQLPVGLSINCASNSQIVYMASCQLTWDVPATATPATYRIDLRGTNASQASGDNRKMDTRIEIKIEVTP